MSVPHPTPLLSQQPSTQAPVNASMGCQQSPVTEYWNIAGVPFAIQTAGWTERRQKDIQSWFIFCCSVLDCVATVGGAYRFTRSLYERKTGTHCTNQTPECTLPNFRAANSKLTRRETRFWLEKRYNICQKCRSEKPRSRLVHGRPSSPVLPSHGHLSRVHCLLWAMANCFCLI